MGDLFGNLALGFSVALSLKNVALWPGLRC